MYKVQREIIFNFHNTSNDYRPNHPYLLAGSKHQTSLERVQDVNKLMQNDITVNLHVNGNFFLISVLPGLVAKFTNLSLHTSIQEGPILSALSSSETTRRP